MIIDFQKAFDRVRYKAVWANMRKYILNVNIIRVTENLYGKGQSAVLFSGSACDWFRTTVGQGCLLSQILYNISLETIMCKALDDNEGSVSVTARLITNFRVQITFR